jgi:hypothetical protein
MIITTTSIVQLCSKMAALSSNQAGLVTADFLNFANLVMMALTSEIMQAREEYLNYQDSIPVAAGATQVRIPYRAVNGTLRHVWWEDGTGSRRRLYGTEIESIENYFTTSTGTPDRFYVLGNNIVLLPTPVSAGSLLVAYPFRPNLLVDATTTQTVASDTTTSVTLNNMPSNFTNGALYDIIDNQSGNGIIYYDQVGTISGNTITFANPIPLVAPGHYIALANQSPVPMLPEEAHPLLLELTVMRVEMVRGNPGRIKNSSVVVTDARKAFDALLNNRVVSKPKSTGTGGAQFPVRPY